MLHQLQEARNKGYLKLNKEYCSRNEEFIAAFLEEDNEKAMAEIQLQYIKAPPGMHHSWMDDKA